MPFYIQNFWKFSENQVSTWSFHCTFSKQIGSEISIFRPLNRLLFTLFWQNTVIFWKFKSEWNCVENYVKSIEYKRFVCFAFNVKKKSPQFKIRSCIVSSQLCCSSFSSNSAKIWRTRQRSKTPWPSWGRSYISC